MTPRTVLALVAAACALLGPAVGRVSTAPGPEIVAIYPRVSFEPAVIRVRVRIPPAAANRGACFAIDGPEYRQSCWELDGEFERRTTFLEYHALPAGEYMAQLVVVLVDGTTQRSAPTGFRVIGARLDARR